MDLHFHNPHFQVHPHDLSRLPYEQPLKYLQDNQQRYTLKERQPKAVIWSLITGSSSISCHNFLASLILKKRETPLEYKLMTCLPNAFAVFSPFSLSPGCFYAAYVLLMVSLLALSTLPCVHLYPNKCALSLSMTLFNTSRFLCCSVPSFGVSTASPKISPTTATIFVKCRNRCHMKNNIRYKGNTNNTSVIIFLTGGQINSQRCYFVWSVRWGFCDVGCRCSFILCFSCCCCISILLLFFICRCSSFTFAFRHHPSLLHGLSLGFYTHFILSGQPIADWFAILSFSTIPLSSYRKRYSFQWAFFTHSRFYLMLLHRHFTCVYQDFPGSRQFYLEVCWDSYWSSKHWRGPSVCLIHSNPQFSYSQRFDFKFYQTLSWITCGKSLVYLLLTRFELFSLVQTYVTTIKKHFEQD